MNIEKIIKQNCKSLDKEIYKFLKQNGYDLEENNIEQLLTLKERLAFQDKQLRVEYISNDIHNNDGQKISYTSHYVIFFDSISHPLTREEILRKAKALK